MACVRLCPVVQGPPAIAGMLDGYKTPVPQPRLPHEFGIAYLGLSQLRNARAACLHRWVLCQPAVTVALAAPDGRQELDEVLDVISPWQAMPPGVHSAISGHGDRVYRHGGGFP